MGRGRGGVGQRGGSEEVWGVGGVGRGRCGAWEVWGVGGVGRGACGA